MAALSALADATLRAAYAWPWRLPKARSIRALCSRWANAPARSSTTVRCGRSSRGDRTTTCGATTIATRLIHVAGWCLAGRRGAAARAAWGRSCAPRHPPRVLPAVGPPGSSRPAQGPTRGGRHELARVDRRLGPLVWHAASARGGLGHRAMRRRIIATSRKEVEREIKRGRAGCRIGRRAAPASVHCRVDESLRARSPAGAARAGGAATSPLDGRRCCAATDPCLRRSPLPAPGLRRPTRCRPSERATRCPPLSATPPPGATPSSIPRRLGPPLERGRVCTSAALPALLEALAPCRRLRCG